MVTPAMQQQPPPVIYGPNGERAEWNGREYIEVRPAAQQASPQQGPIPGLIQMETPQQRAQAEERAYDRQRDTVRDERAARTEERQVETQERLARTEERAVAATELVQRGGTPELRGRLALGLGPSVRAVDSMASQHQGVNPLNRDWGATLIDSVPDFGLLSAVARGVGGQDYQDYNQSLKTVESSLLPIFSGMAVTPTEAQRFMKANQPQLGDSPETIQRKTHNVQIILNEGAFLAGREIPYPEVGRYGEEGFRELIATGDAAGVTAPRIGGREEVSTATPSLAVGTSSEDRAGRSDADLEAAGYVRGPDGGWRKQYTEDELQAMGLRFDGEKWVGAADGAEPPDGPADPDGGGSFNPTGGFAAFQRGALGQLPFSDEIAAGIGSAITGQSYGDIRQGQEALADYDRENNSEQRNLGGIAGATAGIAAAPLGAPLGVTRGASLAGRVVNRAAGGAAFGGAYGSGADTGNALERIDGAAGGALVGAAGGVGAPVAANVLARVASPVIGGLQSLNRAIARPVVNALGDRAPVSLREAVAVNPLRSGMDRFADRSRQAPDAMTSNALALRAQEIEPTFADVVNDGGRGTLRALATRQTPARQAAREFADGRAAGLQDRVSTQARRTISDDPRQPAQIREEITTRRNRQADEQFGAVRGDRVSPDREIMEALRTPAIRPAIEEAATSAANRGDMETAGMLRSLAGDALDYGPDAQLTVGMADRIARSLNGRAEAFKRAGNSDAAASHFALAERLRGGAREQVPGYDQALTAYSQDSGLAAATELGEQFMTMEADAFAAAIARLSPEERQIAQAAARRAVERQAGTQGQAPGVAQRLSNGREQSARTAALVGDAAPVQQAMGAELQILRNAQGISPAQGSPTSMNAQDAMGAVGLARDVVSVNPLGLAGRALNAIRSRGFSDAEAEAVVQAAINPAQTDQLINMLAQRMSRREARSLARAIRYQLTTGPQTAQPQ